MTENAPNRTVLLIGATGALGSLIARELLARGATLRLLIRENSRHKLAGDIAEHAEIVDDAPDIFTGIDTVISAVQGGTGTIVDAQLRWLGQARDAGVRRFIPSAFSVDFFNLDDGDNIHSDFRREFARKVPAVKGDVEIVNILNGGFLDRGVLYGFLDIINLEKHEAYLWGDGSEKMHLTTYADTAKYTAAAALDPGELPEKLYVAGDHLDFHSLVAETEVGLVQKFTVIRRGSLADLDRKIDEVSAQGPSKFSAVPYMYVRALFSGKGKLGPLSNDRYPDIHPLTVRAYTQSMMKGES